MRWLYSWATKMEVRLHFKSGKTLRCFATTLKTTYTATGALSKINVEGQRGFPHHADVERIEAITTHNVPFWRSLT